MPIIISLSNMRKSVDMNTPCQNLTSSSVTIREMGTKLTSIRIHEPTSWMNSSVFERPDSPSIPLSSHLILSSVLDAYVVPTMAASVAKMNWEMKMIKMVCVVRRSRSEILNLGFELFIMTLVVCPE